MLISDMVTQAGFQLKDIELYTMQEINLGMHVQSQKRAVYAVHKPTKTFIIADSGKSQYESVTMAIGHLKDVLARNHDNL